MTTRALLLCDGAPAPPGTGDPALIRERIDWRRASATVNFRADNLDDTVLGVVDERAADLIQIATCAFAADQAISRGGETVVTPRSEISATEDQARMFLFDAGVDLNEIVQAVNQVGAAPGDLVAILEALKEAGALRAELIVI